ncbi:MAG: carbon starvation CstA family protein [Candidatus Margulisbacteria bacterium]|nr:carbon starvation CstA family protein [Candidatus Margulisiibacteriota bacterium]
MNIAFLWLVTVPLFLLAYIIYGGYISKVLGVDKRKKTPALAINDQVDYVPTKPTVLFAHHFSAIAGAGPIVGPTIAMLYGYLPVWLWIIVGAVFFGAVHDFTSLFVSVRERGRSMAEVAGQTLGKSGFILFISFTIIMLVLVDAAFLGLTAKALTSLAPLKILGVDPGQSVFKTVTVDGVESARIGGIASTSTLIITLFSPLLGYLLFKRGANLVLMSLLATIVAAGSITFGFFFPVSIDYRLWMVILSVYVFFAAGIPVWVILQPRDLVNVQILYAGVVLLSLGIISCAFSGLTLSAPAFNLEQAANNSAMGFIWPVLFITVACGAISGFHALVSGGTSAKQVENEDHAQGIGFGGMLLEGLLAVCVISVIAAGLKYADYLNIVFPADISKSNPILAFALASANILKQGLGIPSSLGAVFGILLVEGFVITTLDTAVRLNRYLFEELWLAIFKVPPKILKSYFFNSFLAVGLMFLLGYTNAYITIWPIFGTGNQLLAALTLIAISAWLMVRGKPAWFTIIPALFMIATTFVSLLLLLFTKYLPTANYPLVFTDLVLIGLSVGVVAKGAQLFIKVRKGTLSSIHLQQRQAEDQLAEKGHFG